MTTPPTIYLSGPMTGIDRFNFPAFDTARDLLVGQGWTVYSPADYDRESGFDETRPAEDQGFNYKAALLNDMHAVAHSDAIYLLNGWGHSKGATAEYSFAVALGKQVIHQSEHEAPRVIGLGGALRSGKDTVADHLVEKHGFVKIGMSDPLLEALLALDPIVHVAPNGNEPNNIETFTAREALKEFGYTIAKAEFPEFRALLQRLGTEVGRNLLGENVWTDLAVKRINALVADGKSVVITGVRFPNEVQMFERVTGATVTTAWVYRPDVEVDAGVSAHASEQSVSAPDFDKVIDNDGTLDDLYAAVNSTFNV